MIGKHFECISAEWQNDRTIARFRYALAAEEETFTFEETLAFPASVPECAEAESLLRALHLALAMSYYKALIPPSLSHPYELTEGEAMFWNSVWQNGFAEFLYRNKLPVNKLAQFSAQDGVKLSVHTTAELNEQAVVGIGGGKDSIVAGELLKSITLPTSGFVLATGETLGQSQAVASVMGIELAAVKRVIDPKLLELNKQDGVFNGHIPISVIFALIGCMIALVVKAKYVVVANEASASLPQTNWDGTAVNHQWSKSLAFEQLFQDYVSRTVSPELHYFSAVRPLTSVAIAKLFSNYPQYFEVFTSDNSVFKISPQERDHPRWSLHSSKSLSSYILLSTWLTEAELVRIFGRNLLDEPSLNKLCIDILGGGEPVLDCVGTPEELRTSLVIALEKGHVRKSSVLIGTARAAGLLENTQPLASYLQLDSHVIPHELTPRLLHAIQERL